MSIMTAATPQTTVFFRQGFGVVGEVFDNGPSRVQSYTLDSASAAYNVFGVGFSVLGSTTPSGGQANMNTAQAGNPSTSAVFAGILISPKNSPLYGDGVNPLNPSLTLPNNVQGQLLIEGAVVVAFAAAAAIGNWVVYDQTTGALATVAPGASLPTGKSWAYAYVDNYPVVLNGGQYIGVIRVGVYTGIPV
jgi:hypothetical protein